MSVKAYKLTWLIFLVIAALTFLSGNMTPLVGVIFGHVVFGMIFMGMMVVLPTSISHPAPASQGPGALKRARSVLSKLRGRVSQTSGSWMSPNTVEVRHPKYH